MNLYQPTITGSLSVSGSVNISGSITIAGGGTISGTASIATNAITASSADNFLVRNTLTAQTLVVQTITSSVLYSSGSNVFGNNVANTQIMTGSVTVTGSLAVVTNGTEFQVNATGVKIGNILTDSHSITGSVSVSGSLSGSSAVFNGFLGINGSPGTAFPLEAYINSSTAYSSTSRGNVMRVYNSNASSNVFAGIELGGAGPSNDGLAGLNGVVTSAGSAALTFYTRDSNTFSEKMRITSTGNVGIGTQSPTSSLDVKGTSCEVRSFSSTTSDYANFITDTDNNTNYRGQLVSFGTTAAGTLLGNSRAAGTFLVKSGGILGIGTRDTQPVIFGTNETEKMRILSGGSVLFGRTTAGLTNGDGTSISGGSVQPETNGYVFYGNRTSSDGLFIGIRRNNVDVGSISVTTSATAFNTSSDYRLKQDLKEFNGLSIINSIKTYDYEWKIDSSRAYGVIAHEIQEILPYVVFGEKDEINEDETIKPQAVDYSKLVPILIKAIQEQQAQITELKNK